MLVAFNGQDTGHLGEALIEAAVELTRPLQRDLLVSGDRPAHGRLATHLVVLRAHLDLHLGGELHVRQGHVGDPEFEQLQGYGEMHRVDTIQEFAK